MNPVFSRSCYQQSSFCLSGNLFVLSTFSPITAFSNSSFSKFKLLQIQASSNSSFEKFWLFQILALKICLQIPASRNSSFFKFRLRKIQASKNSGFGKFWLQKILFLITVSSLQTPLTFLVESWLENLDHLGFSL